MTGCMERRLLRLLLVRLLIFATPFLAWLVWRELARRAGRPIDSLPWAWLVAAGSLLAALSLMATAVVPRGRDTGAYVPAEVQADGTVTPGRFVKREDHP